MNESQALPLRDIHLPEAVSWWPPGPGWWLLLILFVLGIVAICYVYRLYLKRALSRAALTELANIKIQYRHELDLRQLAVNLSALLRRTSISLWDRKSIAALSGDEWLAWLDQQLAVNQFQNGPGQYLISAPYQAKPEFNPDALIELCQHWLEIVPRQQLKRSTDD